MYDYKKMKEVLLTEDGKEKLKAITKTIYRNKGKILKFDNFVEDLKGFDAWTVLACIDHLEEEGYITLLSDLGVRQDWTYQVNERKHSSLRNYEEGKKVTSMDEIFKHIGFIWRGKYYHQSFLISWQTKFLHDEINSGRVFIAKKITEEEVNDKTE